MHRIKKYQNGNILEPAYVYASKKMMPSFNAPLAISNSNSTPIGLNIPRIDTEKRNSMYQSTFGATYDQLQSAGINVGDYSSVRDVKEAYKKSQEGGFGSNPAKGMALSSIASGVGSIMNGIEDQLYSKGGYDNNSANSGAKTTRGGLSDAAISSGIPIAMAIGAASKVVDGIMDSTGIRGESISKKDADKVGISGVDRFINNFNNFLPGNPLALGGKQLTGAEKSADTERIRGAYTGTLDDIDTAGTYGGRRLSFLSGLTGATNKMENFINEQNRKNDLLTNIGRTNTLRKLNDYGLDLERQNFKKYSGESYQSTAIGKQGMKLLSKEELAVIYSSKKPVETNEQVSKFQNGGSILIPEGALHAHKHYMEEENPELAEELTKKGIPVIVTNENGEVEQVAEIEKEEIILEKSLTQQIEELWKDGSEEAMIKAGKIITETMFKNCDDNANLIERTE